MAERGSPQLSPQRGRFLSCKVLMLDNVTQVFPVAVKSPGHVLFSAVVEKLHLLEADYFDIQYSDVESIPCWLDREKLIIKQVSPKDLNFRFLVKFYTPDPGLLEEELTRYLFALQVKRDLICGTLYCQEHTAVLLASFIVQAEVGDYLDDLAEQDYLSQMKLLPNQTKEIQMKIMEHHKEHVNQSASDADFNLLDTARKVELYGIHMHPAKDHEGISLHLAVAHVGIIVFQNYTKINSFSWAKIRKLCFQRKKYIIKLHTDGGAYNKNTVEFYFPSRNWAKTFWKKCIEHHAFFRCHSVRHGPRSKSHVVSRGSSFRYTGKTQKELIEYVRENYETSTPFERSTSMRTMSALNSRAGTPKAGTLSSHDLHFGVHQTSFSSGSRTLDRGSSQMSSFGHANTKDSESHGGAAVSPMNQNRMFNTFQARPTQASPSDGFGGNHSTHRPIDSGRHPSSEILDPSQFMLSKEGHKLASSAVFASSRSTSRETATDEYRYNRQCSQDTDEQRFVLPYSRPQNMQQVGQNEIATGGFGGGSFRQDSGATFSEDDLPPPPPPIYDDGGARRQRTRLLSRDHNVKDDTLATGTSKSTASAASITLTSNASIISSQTDESEEEGKKKKFLADKSYYIVKELLMTERTYKKDLEVITVRLHDAVSHDDTMPDYLMETIFGTLAPIYECHCTLLRELEQRITIWEGKLPISSDGDVKNVGDIFLRYMNMLQWYRNYLDRQDEVLVQMDIAMKRHKDFEQLVNEFEGRKVCYLPLTAFFMKPLQRLLHYKLILERLLKYYHSDYSDVKDCRECLVHLTEITDSFRERLKHLENRQKLIELERDLSGIDNLVQPGRLFLREGCLHKLSRKGSQQRMFFLFSDLLVYTSRTSTPSLQFKVHGQMSLRGMTVEETDVDVSSTDFSFTIYGSSRCVIVSASCQEEKDKWMEDIRKAIRSAIDRNDDNVKSLYSSLKSNSSSEALEDSHDDLYCPPSPDRQIQQRANMTIHVCWHRNTSVGIKDLMIAIQNQLSGYLLRKFKNSNGWQKLWVVFTNFCLFFYKNFQDDFPLASLPLLGYSVSKPSDTDAINKEFVFKLQFKNHVYFFRADSEYTFERWLEVIGSVTCAARITRIFSRMDSTMSPLPQPPELHHF